MEKKSICPDDNVYYNVTVNNPQAATTLKLATFTENRTQAIISKPCEYYLTIARFTIPGVALPLFVFPITLPPLGSPLEVTLSFGGADFTTNVVYQPRNLELVPTSPDNAYYFVYNYQHMIDMVNTALATAFANLKAAFPAAPPTQAPYFTYDADTKIVSLFAQQLYAGAGTISIFFNTQLYRFFTAFEVEILGYNLTTFKDVRYIIEDTKNNTPVTPAGYFRMDMQFPMLYLWNSLKNIVFLTGTIPLKYEYLPALNGSGANNFLPILTDFEPNQDLAGETRSNLNYFPQGPYRLIDMNGDVPLTKFDVSIFWQDHNDVLRPLYLLPGTVATIKFLFVKRVLYKVDKI